MRPAACEALEPRRVLAAYSFVGENGDLVTVSTSKGSAAALAAAVILSPSGPGFHLDSVVLSNPVFAGTNLSILAATPTGAASRVDVGDISTARSVGNVEVGGDLISLHVNTLGAAGYRGVVVQSLHLQSLGLRANAFVASEVRGRVATLKVDGNVTGIKLGAASIGALVIGGSLVGSGAAQSGRVACTGRISSVSVSGSIFGGGGEQSGGLAALSIGKVAVGISLVGGNGDYSGSIAAGTIGPISIGMHLIGGHGAGSGVIETSKAGIASLNVTGSVTGGDGGSSGRVIARTSLGAVTIGGSLVGGSGPETAHIAAWSGMLQSVTIGQSFVGGTATESGLIYSVGGTVGSIVVGGDIVGGVDHTANIFAAKITGVTAANLRGGTGVESAMIHSTGTLGSVTIMHDIVGGTAFWSGSILAAGNVASVSVGGSVLGGAANYAAAVVSGGILGKFHVGGDVVGTRQYPVVITATGSKAALALPDVAVVGGLSRALVVAGCTAGSTSIENGRARIGSVSVGYLSASSIVAGVDAIMYPYYGTFVKPGPAPFNGKIGSVTISLGASGSADPGEEFGIVASGIGSITLAGSKVILPPTGKVVPLGQLGNLVIHIL